jgi:formamidopyrimidine-DNA glycosylase
MSRLRHREGERAHNGHSGQETFQGVFHSYNVPERMPELPEVEAVCRKLRKHAIGATLVSAHVERRRITAPQDPVEVETLATGRTIERIDRRGKNILIGFSGGLTMRVHLRMTGNLYVVSDWRLRVAGVSAWFELDDGRGLIFEDTRGLGSLTIHDAASLRKLLDGLGPEPLSRGFTAAAFIRSAAGLRQPAKQFLMDQRRVAGLGNIYAAEALFAARIDPRAPIGSISRRKLTALWEAIVRLLRNAVRSAYSAYSRPGGFQEGEDFPLLVYGREAEDCLRCGVAIRRIAQGGRSTYFCPKCQR